MKLDLPREREYDSGVWYSTRASTWYPAHYHDELELKLVLWGNTAYRIGTQRVELKAGSMLWLAPGQEHSLLGASDDLAMWVASYRAHTARAAERASGAQVLDRPRGFGTCQLPLDCVRQLSNLHATLAACKEPNSSNALALRLLTCSLASARPFYSAQRGEGMLGLAPGASPHAAVARARDLLRGPEADLSLERLARQCGLDSFRLSRLFKQQMGLSVVQFRNHLRVQRFITRFDHGQDRTMLDLALEAGFGSYPQFHRAFHQVAGYSPSEHLRRVRAGIVFPSHGELV